MDRIFVLTYAWLNATISPLLAGFAVIDKQRIAQMIRGHFKTGCKQSCTTLRVVFPGAKRLGESFNNGFESATIRLALIASMCLAFSSSAFACQIPVNPNPPFPPPHPNKVAGTVIGGASGSLIGAAFGSENGKTGEGALIGGLIGAVAGGIFGDQADRANEARRNYLQQQHQTHVRSAVTIQQVIQMTRGGLSPEVIANQIDRNGVSAKPTTDDLLLLKQNGVSDDVIGALQRAPSVNEPGSRRVVFEEVYPVFPTRRIYVRPAPAYRFPVPPPRYYHRPYLIRVGHGHHH